MTTESVLELWSQQPRVLIMNGAETGITTTAEVMEFSRDIGRKWGDLHEIFVWEDGVKLDGNTLYYFQAIHQESDVIPENVDAIRALMGLETDWKASVKRPMMPLLRTMDCSQKRRILKNPIGVG